MADVRNKHIRLMNFFPLAFFLIGMRVCYVNSAMWHCRFHLNRKNEVDIVTSNKTNKERILSHLAAVSPRSRENPNRPFRTASGPTGPTARLTPVYICGSEVDHPPSPSSHPSHRRSGRARRVKRFDSSVDPRPPELLPPPSVRPCGNSHPFTLISSCFCRWVLADRSGLEFHRRSALSIDPLASSST
jgi:hypothetical protein